MLMACAWLMTQCSASIEFEAQTRYPLILSQAHIFCVCLQHMSCDMRFPTIWHVRPAKAQTSLHIRAV